MTKIPKSLRKRKPSKKRLPWNPHCPSLGQRVVKSKKRYKRKERHDSDQAEPE